jgi:hypothetical protein
MAPAMLGVASDVRGQNDSRLPSATAVSVMVFVGQNDSRLLSALTASAVIFIGANDSRLLSVMVTVLVGPNDSCRISDARADLPLRTCAADSLLRGKPAMTMSSMTTRGPGRAYNRMGYRTAVSAISRSAVARA